MHISRTWRSILLELLHSIMLCLTWTTYILEFKKKKHYPGSDIVWHCFVQHGKTRPLHITDDRSRHKLGRLGRIPFTQHNVAIAADAELLHLSRPKRPTNTQRERFDKDRENAIDTKRLGKTPEKRRFVWERGQGRSQVTVGCFTLSTFSLSVTVLLILTKLSKGKGIPFKVVIQHLLYQNRLLFFPPRKPLKNITRNCSIQWDEKEGGNRRAGT